MDRVEEEAEVKRYLRQYIQTHGHIYCAECRAEISTFRYRQDAGAVCVPCDGALDIVAQSPNGDA